MWLAKNARKHIRVAPVNALIVEELNCSSRKSVDDRECMFYASCFHVDPLASLGVVVRQFRTTVVLVPTVDSVLLTHVSKDAADDYNEKAFP
jgi:hypothetical protein